MRSLNFYNSCLEYIVVYKINNMNIKNNIMNELLKIIFTNYKYSCNIFFKFTIINIYILLVICKIFVLIFF